MSDADHRLVQEVRGLTGLDLEALREVWRGRYGDPPKLRSPDLLRRWLAWRLQSEALGGLSTVTRRAVAAADPVSSKTQLESGTRLAREWRGVRHDVEVVEEGILYRGQLFASLSEVARRITGVRWNGPRFFGLRAPKQG